MRPLVLLLALTACGDDAALSPDAPIDTPPDSLPVPAGNFTCVGQPPRLTAPDPVVISGSVSTGGRVVLNGAQVEIRRVTNDALLGSATSGGIGGVGRYGISVATAGVAPSVYRHSVAAGTLDTYLWDAFPLFFSGNGPLIINFTAAEMSAYYGQAGVTEEASKTQVDLVVLDCPDANGVARGVAGAKVTVSGVGRAIYLDAQQRPNPSLTETSTTGLISLFNAPVGPLDITVVAGPYTYRTPVVRTHAGAYTIAYLSP